MPQQQRKKKQPNKIVFIYSVLTGKIQFRWNRFKSHLNRSTFAYLFMFSFIILTSIGAGLIFPPAGLVVGGVGCGLFGFILGLK
jgi:hypothetical protein